MDKGQTDLEENRVFSRKTSDRFGLEYDELKGSDRMLQKLINGPRDDEFVVIEKGGMFTFEHFI